MLLAAIIDLPAPPGDGRETLLSSAGQIYRPLIALLRSVPRARITLNVLGRLSERLRDERFADILSGWRDLALEGRIELTGGAKFHPLLALIPKEEVRRQIRLNEETNRAIFGDAYRPRGFCPPELAVSPEVLRTIEEMGYSWCLADEIGYSGLLGRVPRDRLFQAGGVSVHFVSRQFAAREPFQITTATPSREQLESNETVTMSELELRVPAREAIVPLRSSARTSEDDSRRRVPFAAWQDPAEPDHQEYWALLQLTIDAVSRAEAGPGPARQRLDEALHSSFAGSRIGARKLLEVLELLGSAVTPEVVEQARAAVSRIQREDSRVRS
jgi:hypothetical protein